MDTLFLLMKDISRGKGREEQVNFTTKTSQVLWGSWRRSSVKVYLLAVKLRSCNMLCLNVGLEAATRLLRKLPNSGGVKVGSRLRRVAVGI